MRPLFAPRRVVEATPQQVAISGGGLGSWHEDPIDHDRGYRLVGGEFRRDVPPPTRELLRDHAVTSYRINPMCTAIIDTHVAFAVGDTGVSPMCTEEKVREVVEEFWYHPDNNLGNTQDVHLRSQLLIGEQLWELMEGPNSGVLGYMPIEPSAIKSVDCLKGNPMWPDRITLPPNNLTAGEDEVLRVARVRAEDGLREGNCVFWAPWRDLNTTYRGIPFIHSILDWLDNYDLVLSNLIDRTALARYAAFEVILKGASADVDAYIRARQGTHLPPSGSIEVHNESVEWKPLHVQSGSFEDTRTNGAILTSVAAGSGLSRVWLADPEDANRATSMSMAEPTRRRVGAVQKTWLGQMTELCRVAVDRAVAAKRLPAMVEVTDPKTGAVSEIPASMAVTVTGPKIAAADAQIAAGVLLNLSTGLEKLVSVGLLSQEAAEFASRKAWEDFMGVPWRPELSKPTANPGDVATAVDDAATANGATPTAQDTNAELDSLLASLAA